MLHLDSSRFLGRVQTQTLACIFLYIYNIYIYIFSGWNLSYVVAGVPQRVREDEPGCGIVPHLERNINNAETWG